MKYLINQVIQSKMIYLRGVFENLPWAFSLLLVLVIAACATVPHTGRRQFNMVSDQQLNSLANKAFTEVLDKEPKCQDPKLNEIAQRVADRISEAAEAIDKPAFKWDLRVVNKDVPNAFCLPGGKIVVYTGIIPYVKNEAGLAAVVAHEVSHAVARHGGERMSQQLALKGAMTVGGEMLKKKDGTLDKASRVILGALGMGGTVGVILPYSRIHELEADRIGQLYMAKAGYDPTESANLWERMSKIQKPPIPVWLSTHPADEERVRKLRESLPEAQKAYAQSPVKYGLGTQL
jgi:metalloendopeptidase OMA1, mitochondrial